VPVSRLILVFLLWLPAQGTPAQSPQFPLYDDSAVALLNRDVVLNESAYGKAVSARLAEQQATLQEENDRLLEILEEEERALTETRKTVEPEAFAPLAEAFDAKTNSIRARQEAKAFALAKALEQARLTFFRDIEPVILEVMHERGVSILLNEQAVMASLAGADITNDVMARLDQLFAHGQIGVRP